MAKKKKFQTVYPDSDPTKPWTADSATEIPKAKEISPADLTHELSWASSSYYDKYLLRPYNPDELVQSKGGIKIYSEMREDDQIKAVLALKKHSILSSGWEIIPATKDDIDEEIMEFVSDNLTERISDFDAILWEILSAIDYGFSLHETIYKEENGYLWIDTFKHRAPHTFEFHTDERGNLKTDGLRQWGKEGLKPLPQNKFIYYVYQREFENYYGKSDLRSCYRAWWSKDLIIKFWNIYLERFGSPLAIAKYDPAKIKTEIINRLQNMLDRIQQKTSMIVPKDIEIELVEAIGKGPDQYKIAVDAYNLMIARSLLMPDLMGFSKPIEGGSYALGKEQFNIFFKIIQSIQKDIANCVKRQIIKRLVDLNFNRQWYPEFKFKPLLENDKHKLLEMYMNAVSTGILAPSIKDRNYFREVIGFPKEQTEEEAGGVQPFKQAEKKYEFDRELTVFEQRLDFKKLEGDLTKQENKAQVMLSEVFAEMIYNLIDQINKKKIVENRDIEKIDTIQIPDVGRLKKSLTRYLVDTYKMGNVTADETLAKIISKKKKMKLGEELLPEEAMQFFNNKAFYITGVERDNILKKAKVILFNGIRDGGTVKEIDDSLEGLLDEYDTELVGGRTQTIVRTNLAEAFNQGLKHVYEDPSLEGFVKAYQWSAILDGRTTPLCRWLDSKIYKIDDPIWQKLKVPAHFNCRSILIPLTEVDDFEVSMDYPPMEEAGYGFWKLSYQYADEKFIILQLRPIEDFDDTTIATTEIDRDAKIYAIVGKVKGTSEFSMKEIHFDKEAWDIEKATAWAKEKGYIFVPDKNKVYQYLEDNFIVVSQRPSADFDFTTLATIDLEKEINIKAVIGKLNGSTENAIKELHFDKQFWTPNKVRLWLTENKYSVPIQLQEEVK